MNTLIGLKLQICLWDKRFSRESEKRIVVKLTKIIPLPMLSLLFFLLLLRRDFLVLTNISFPTKDVFLTNAWYLDSCTQIPTITFFRNLCDRLLSVLGRQGHQFYKYRLRKKGIGVCDLTDECLFKLLCSVFVGEGQESTK